jgi:hypothetical protein
MGSEFADSDPTDPGVIDGARSCRRPLGSESLRLPAAGARDSCLRRDQPPVRPSLARTANARRGLCGVGEHRVQCEEGVINLRVMGVKVRESCARRSRGNHGLWGGAQGQHWGGLRISLRYSTKHTWKGALLSSFQWWYFLRWLLLFRCGGI